MTVRPVLPVFWPVPDAPELLPADPATLWPQLAETSEPSATTSNFRLRQAFGGVALLALLFLVSSTIITNTDHTMQNLSSVFQVLGYLLRWLPWLWTAILIHELGHALALRWTRGELKAMGVYPLILGLQAGRWQLKVRWGGWTSLGFAHGWPRSMSTFRRDQLGVYLAGPLASGLWAILALRMQDAAGSGPVWAQRASGLWASSAVAVLVMLALDLFVARGDLRVSWSVWRRNAWAQELEALATLQLEHGRPRDWPRVMVDVALTARAASPFRSDLAWMVMSWAWDTGDLALVGEVLEQLCSRLPQLNPGEQALVWCEVAEYSALVRQDLPSAQAALRRATGPFEAAFFHGRLRAEASVLLLEGHTRVAFEAARAGEDALRWIEDRRPAWELSWVERFLARAGAATLDAA